MVGDYLQCYFYEHLHPRLFLYTSSMGLLFLLLSVIYTQKIFSAGIRLASTGIEDHTEL